jgi:hypothetical protein
MTEAEGFLYQKGESVIDSAGWNYSIRNGYGGDRRSLPSDKRTAFDSGQEGG